MTKFLSCAETAKLIRKALGQAFPGIRFGVRSHTYAGGASIHVSWTDGPIESRVRAVAGQYRGAYFDAMQDCKVPLVSLLDGERVSFGADYILYDRAAVASQQVAA